MAYAKAMAVLFEKNLMTVNEHINNIYNEGELDEKATIRKSLIVQQEGNRKVSREILLQNLRQCPPENLTVFKIKNPPVAPGILQTLSIWKKSNKLGFCKLLAEHLSSVINP